MASSYLRDGNGAAGEVVLQSYIAPDPPSASSHLYDDPADIRQQPRTLDPKWEDGGYVFTRKDASALNPPTLTRAFRWIVDHSELTRIRLHDLRHTHASIAVNAGVPIGVVSERLGHASPEFTLHRYSHVMPGMQPEAAHAVARAVRIGR